MNREYALLSTIDRFRTVPGKKALHKILYFTNLQTDDFIYRWNNYGPYSDEVQQFFDDSYLDNTISIKEEQLNNYAIQYNTSLEERGRRTLEALRENPLVNRQEIDNAIDFAYELLHDKTPRQMELLASTHYIASYYNELDSDEIWRIIDNLKPGSHFTLQEIEDSLATLHQFNLAQ